MRACEKLTEITAQLKTILVVNDFSQINKSVDELNVEAAKEAKSLWTRTEKHDENVINMLSTFLVGAGGGFFSSIVPQPSFHRI